jgi:hypothetical protein
MIENVINFLGEHKYIIVISYLIIFVMIMVFFKGASDEN